MVCIAQRLLIRSFLVRDQREDLGRRRAGRRRDDGGRERYRGLMFRFELHLQDDRSYERNTHRRRISVWTVVHFPARSSVRLLGSAL